MSIGRRDQTRGTRTVFSVDVDWAPDWMLLQLAERLLEAECNATWFATGESAVLRSLSQFSGQEVGLHPNFASNSSHGEDYRSVFDHLINLYPSALGFRSHSLHVSSRILQHAGELGLVYDSNLLIESDARVEPFFSCHGILRFSHHFSDAVALQQESRDLSGSFGILSGKLNVLDFHPVHLWLGSASVKSYEAIKAYLASRQMPLNFATESELVPFREDSTWPLLAAFLKEAAGARGLTFEQILAERRNLPTHG